jgi:hypothetical protein
MTDPNTSRRRLQRSAALRRRATAASLGILLSASALVAVTTPLGEIPAGSAAPTSSSAIASNDPMRQPAPAPVQQRRIRTRQS